MNIQVEQEFWKHRDLKDFTDKEWEAVCDGCGKCCYNKYISGSGRKTRLYYTKVACDFLNLRTNRCTVYEKRFTACPDCKKLTRENLADYTWLPDSCAYRMLAEGKELAPWHPLVSGTQDSVQKSGNCIQGGIHEKDCGDWMDFVLSSEKYRDN